MSITVLTAPPYATVQDLGRVGHRASGVAQSGVMDANSARMVNALVGNPANAAVLEWAIAGGTLRFDRATTIAIGGAGVIATLNGTPLDAAIAVRVQAGAELRVERFVRGRFLYVAVAGGIDVPPVLGSRSTNLVAGFGGHEGRRLRRGDVLPVGVSTGIDTAKRAVAEHDAVLTPIPIRDPSEITVVRVSRGPQASLFNDTAWGTFHTTTFIVAHASDRMGYRLDGPILSHRGAAALPSEPVCVGAIQVPDGGTPIVLMHDGPTVGGYPKIAVIASADLGRFAQLMPGARVQFTTIV